MRIMLQTVCLFVLLVVPGCSHVNPALVSQLQSFGASVTFSSASPAPRRDTLHAAGSAIFVSERCVYSRSRRAQKHPMRVQLSFYAPSLTDDPTRR